MSKKVASFIDLKDTDSIDDLPINYKLLALIFSLNKNKQREALRKEETIRLKKIHKLESDLDAYLKHCIKQAELKKSLSITVQIDREFYNVIDKVLSKPYYNMFKIEFIERYKFYNVRSNIIIRIRRILDDD